MRDIQRCLCQAPKNRHVLLMSAVWAHCSILPGKQARGREFSANLISQNLVDGALLMVTFCINGTPCKALVDTGCTQSLVHKSCCWAWKKKATYKLTVDEGVLTCCGIGVVHVSIGLVWFYGISTFVGYLIPNPFLCK